MSLIDRDDLLVELGSYHIGGLDAIIHYDATQHRDEWTGGLHTAWRAIDDAPVIDHVKHGRWIDKYGDGDWHCSECGYKNGNQWANRYHKFCPNCGAYMKGEQDEAD